MGLIAPGSIPRSLLRTFNFEIWKLKCLGACPEDLYGSLAMMLTHCGNNVRNRYSGCVFSVKDIVPVPLKTSRNLIFTDNSPDFREIFTFPYKFCVSSSQNRIRTAYNSGNITLDVGSCILVSL